MWPTGKGFCEFLQVSFTILGPSDLKTLVETAANVQKMTF